MRFKIHLWLKISLINLFLVALLGALMRYKIGFDFPFFVQKHLLHSHSHFAFSGWISHTLMVLMIYFLKNKSIKFSQSKYSNLIIANLVCSYGMLVFFIIQGYAFWSILFSTLSIFVSYIFAYVFYKDLNKISFGLSKKWFQGALLFYILSSIGTFFLAYTLASGNFLYKPYLSSIYFYLHFQYNGWFLFACIGLLLNFIQPKAFYNKPLTIAFWLLFISTIITYLLSVLWLDLPQWLYFMAVLFSVIQFLVWIGMLVIFRKENKLLKAQPLFLWRILKLTAFCLTLKFIFQLLSVIPSLNQFVFGIRTIIIAYLHLVLLAIITPFLLYYIYANKLLPLNKSIKNGIILFYIGIFMNELVLGIQGMSAFGYILVPKINVVLFGVAFLLLISIGWVAFQTLRNRNLK